MAEVSLTIAARDGYPLAATLFRPPVCHRWGRISLDKAPNQWQNSRILMLTRAGRVTRWRLSGKSRTDRVCPCFPMFLRWLRSQDVAR